MENRHLHINYSISDREDLPPDELLLLDKAFEAAENGYAPFSSFLVGCAVLLEGGEIFVGNNQENIAFPSGMCAERSVLYYIGTQNKGHLIRKIAIRAKSIRKKIHDPVTPCGACRQVMVQHEKASGRDCVLLMQGESGKVLRIVGITKSMMPFNFDLDF